MLSDEFSRTLVCKLWGEHASNDELVEGCHVILERCVVDEWKQIKSLNSTQETRVLVSVQNNQIFLNPKFRQ